MSQRSLFFAFFGLALLAFLGGAGLMRALAPGKVPQESASSSAAIGGPFTLVDTSGNAVSDRTYRGKWMLIYFGYTFCPGACPTALSNMSVALDKLGRKADAIQPIFITVDPKRDTSQAMAGYLKSFDRRIVGLSGTPTQAEAAAKAYRVYVAPQKSDGDDYLVDHSAYFEKNFGFPLLDQRMHQILAAEGMLGGGGRY